MTSRDFAYWLQGYFEVTAAEFNTLTLTSAQVDCIKKHLAMVFIHEIDPSFPKQEQQALTEAHLGSLQPPGGPIYRC